MCGESARAARAECSGEHPAPESRVSACATADSKSQSSAHPPRALEAQCPFCGHAHPLVKCPGFKGLSVPDRTRFVNDHHVCMNCLRVGHAVGECESPNRCFVCQRKHSAFLHVDQPAETPITYVSNACANDTKGACSFIPVVRVCVNEKVTVRAALDSCSSSTFCSQSLADYLNLEGKACRYRLDTLSGETFAESKFVGFTLTAGDESMRLSGVRVVPKIPVNCGSFRVSDFPHLQGLDLSANMNCHEVDILIGQDHADALFPISAKRGGVNGPHAVRYKFGWTLSGRVPREHVSNDVVCHFIPGFVTSETRTQQNNQDVLPPDIHSDISKLWDTEPDIDRPSMSVNDQGVIEFWDANCSKEGSHNVRPIPWKIPCEALPNNFAVAEKRFRSLVKRVTNEGLYECYDNEIQNLLNEGYAKIVPPDDLANAQREWYLPHHGVHDDVRVGELVLVNEVGVPRGLWPLAIVKEIFRGRDGHVRSVLLHSKGSEIRRAITSVIRLEVGR